MKPIFIPASHVQPAGWYIADREGMPLTRLPAFRDRRTCLRAIAELQARA